MNEQNYSEIDSQFRLLTDHGYIKNIHCVGVGYGLETESKLINSEKFPNKIYKYFNLI